MDYRRVGDTGLFVSQMCLGTETFGWGADERTAHAMGDRFVDAGGNFFDTANIYNSGQAEVMLGKWLKKHGARSQYVVATKAYFPVGKNANDHGLSRKHLLSAIDDSLTRLETDYIDLYYVHSQDATTPLEETLDTLNDLVHSGKIRYFGASNFMSSELQRALCVSHTHHWNRFSCLQPEYNLLVRSTEWELLPLCRREGLGVVCYAPLAGGWLTGKYRRDEALPPESRAARGDCWDDLPEQRANDRAWAVIDALREVAKTRGKTPAQVALNWLQLQSGVTAPIVGARTVEQLEENLGALGWQLSGDELEHLDAASRMSLPYPYDYIARNVRGRAPK
ncbi:MAG: aldo/keto reductase [Candidatus Bipolaricaulota bacterium]